MSCCFVLQGRCFCFCWRDRGSVQFGSTAPALQKAPSSHRHNTQQTHNNNKTHSGEFAGAIVYAAELAPPGHRFKSAGAIAVGGQLGMAAGSLFVLVLAVVMSAGVSARE